MESNLRKSNEKIKEKEIIRKSHSTLRENSGRSKREFSGQKSVEQSKKQVSLENQ